MNYNEALEYIHSINWRGSRPGLSRTEELLGKLGNPQNELRFIHIAGTNGKGSTAAMTESVLRRAGYKTGLYTSPYITRFNERIRVNGVDIGDGELARLVDEIKPVAEQMADKPTEFELITAIGMVYFARSKCDIVVLETGLGGELDSTNVIPVPVLAVITALGLDHTDILGPTIEDIARAKAGIIKSGGTVVYYGGEEAADKIIADTCEKKNARLFKPDFSRIEPVSASLEKRVFNYGEYKNMELPLLGAYQMQNAATVITACNVLRDEGWKISDEDIRLGIAGVSWLGRFELLRKNPVFILDGSHNPQGATTAAESLREFFPDKKIVFLSGVMADKDVDHILTALSPLAKVFVTVKPSNPRALDAERYAEKVKAYGVDAVSAASVSEGVNKAAELAGNSGVICAIGSLYMSNDVREAVGKLIR